MHWPVGVADRSLHDNAIVRFGDRVMISTRSQLSGHALIGVPFIAVVKTRGDAMNPDHTVRSDSRWPLSDLLQLRPPTPADQPFMDRLHASPSEYTRFDQRQRTIAERLSSGPIADEQGGHLVVVRRPEGDLIGKVTYHSVYYGPRTPSIHRIWAIGSELLPELRGYGYGTEAKRTLVDWLFTTTDANRIQITTEQSNIAARRSTERVGFRQEGTLRGARYRGGQYRDLIIYGLTRSDWTNPARAQAR
jgi:RimJ/RimL family protein N-acetyltransferase